MLMVLVGNFAKSQEIEYAYESLSGCNIFSSAKTVDNFTHLTTLGRPSFSDNSVVLECKANTSTTVLSTIYSIAYNFKVGYNYKIALNLKGEKDVSDGAYPSVGLKISSTNGGTDNGTNCVDPLSYNLSDALTFNQGASGSSYANSSNLIDVTITQAASYLLVGAFPTPFTAYEGRIFLRKIYIIETAPFSLPATTSIACGSTSPVTFTASNVNSIPTNTITDYTWNVGTTPNGWLHNGSPASATISTGTTNNITLTPSSGTLSNISATVTAGGNTFNTNTSAIATTTSFTITGDASFCSSSNYSVNVPSGTSVTWSASPGGVVSLSQNGSQVTVTRLYNTTFTLTASGTACGVPFSVSKTNITAGFSFSGSYSTSYDGGGQLITYPQEGYNYITEYSYVWANVSGSPSWSRVDGTISSWNYNGYNLEFYLSPSDWVTFRAQVTSGGCTSTQDYTFIATSSYYYSLAPNPVSSDLNIYVDEEKLRKQKIPKAPDQVIQQIIIMDKNGNMVTQQKYPTDTKRARLNVSGLAPDMYIAKIFNGKTWTSIKFMKR